MANLTITVPEEILKGARRRALEQGTSVNAVLRDYLAQFAGTQSAQANAAKRVLELSRNARSGRGKAKWTRDDLAAGTLKPLPMREGRERFAELYLIFADREHAGPATLRLAEIMREGVANECKRSLTFPSSQKSGSNRTRRNRPASQ